MSFSLSPYRPALVLGLVLTGSWGLMAQSTAAKPAASTDPVVISVGAEKITASEFEALIKASPAAEQGAMTSHKRAVADQLAQLLALAQSAQAQGLNQSATFRAQMLLARTDALAQALVSKLQASATPTEAQIEAYYTAHASQFAEAKVRHILIGDSETPGSPIKRTPAEALAKAEKLEAELKQGANFAALAKANSDDPGSKAQGGELGEILPGQTVPQFEAAVAKLPIGQISAPVHTQYGYHIIEVESRSTVPLAQAKSSIVQELTNEAVDADVTKITSGAGIDVSSSYFGPEPAPATAAPAAGQPAAATH